MSSILDTPCVCGWGGPGPCPCPRNKGILAPSVLPSMGGSAGWVCPRCNAVHAPWVAMCADCAAEKKHREVSKRTRPEGLGPGFKVGRRPTLDDYDNR